VLCVRQHTLSRLEHTKGGEKLSFVDYFACADHAKCYARFMRVLLRLFNLAILGGVAVAACTAPASNGEASVAAAYTFGSIVPCMSNGACAGRGGSTQSSYCAFDEFNFGQAAGDNWGVCVLVDSPPPRSPSSGPSVCVNRSSCIPTKTGQPGLEACGIGCLDANQFKPDGTLCSAGNYWDGSACVFAHCGEPCGDGCSAKIVSCASGSPVCVPDAYAAAHPTAPLGTPCTGGVCVAGTCRNACVVAQHVYMPTENGPDSCHRCEPTNAVNAFTEEPDGTTCQMLPHTWSPGTCMQGACCPQGDTNCRGECVDLRDDNANCGACGNACPSGQRCVASACSSTAIPIHVLDASYGANVIQSQYDNARIAVYNRCDGLSSCTFTIDYSLTWNHDPAPSQAKDFSVHYYCGPYMKTVHVPAEAYGQSVTLACP
jgi:hypothetical protein